MADKFFIEVDCYQKNHEGERICGDVFLASKVKEENRIVLVLSDGMGHGVKASVLATLTATMALNFTKEHREPEKIAEIIMNTLPECSERKMNYSTFTTIDITADGFVTILEYDNPECTIIRKRNILELERHQIELKSEKNKGKKLKSYSFQAQKGDRILFSSDGVAQSGLGTPKFPFGWGNDNVGRFAIDMIKREPKLSARQLSTRVVNMAYRNDGFSAKDDTSCGIVYFREPRELLICTGPPYDKESDQDFASHLDQFEGTKVVMGATTGEIIARELGLEIKDGQEFTDPDLPPLSYMEGIDLFTEGVLTLSKVEKILLKYTNATKLGMGPADQIVKRLLDSDEILFSIGTRINLAHQSPETKIDLEMRRTVVKRISMVLEEKFLKSIKIRYW